MSRESWKPEEYRSMVLIESIILLCVSPIIASWRPGALGVFFPVAFFVLGLAYLAAWRYASDKVVRVLACSM